MSRSDWVRGHAAVLVMLLVAGIQTATVHARGLSRWKGGGFAMYTEMHHRSHELWLRLDGNGREPDYEYLDEAELRRLWPTALRCLRHRNAACLQHVIDEIDGVSPPYTVQLWVWDVRGRPLTLQRRLLLEVTAP